MRTKRRSSASRRRTSARGGRRRNPRGDYAKTGRRDSKGRLLPKGGKRRKKKSSSSRSSSAPAAAYSKKTGRKLYGAAAKKALKAGTARKTPRSCKRTTKPKVAYSKRTGRKIYGAAAVKALKARTASKRSRSCPGGTMKKKRKTTRRKSSSRRAPSRKRKSSRRSSARGRRRDARGRFVSSGGSRRRKKSTVKRSKRKASRKKSSSRRRKYPATKRERMWWKAGKGLAFNWGRKRGRRKGARKNPPKLKAQVKKLLQPSLWIQAGHGVLGLSAAIVGPAWIERLSGNRVRNYGYQGVALSAVSAAGAGLVAAYAESFFRKGMLRKALNTAGRNVLIVGLIWTTVRLVQELVPQVGYKLGLPGPSVAALPAAPSGVSGMGDYVRPGALSAGITPNDTLIQGESLARSVNQMGDWMELAGGYPGQYGGGMGDWLATAGGDQLVMAAGFDPALETF